MSYVQAYSGKIAGYGRLNLRGLGIGDASSDQAVAAYNADHALWVQQKAAYDKAMAAYAGQSAGQAASYSVGYAGYLRDLASWNQESAALSQAIVARGQQQTKNQRALDSANAAARAAGVVTPPGYPGCVTQAQHNSWQAVCNTINAPVKGLGADPTGSACALALLPVCPPPLPTIAPLRPKPAPPAPLPTLTPPPALRPEPQPPAPSGSPGPTPTPTPNSSPGTPPVLNTGPQSIPSNVPGRAPLVTAPASKSGGLLSNGLIVVVLAAGGYALYRTLRTSKPKASAA